jgi:hypothetical protein
MATAAVRKRLFRDAALAPVRGRLERAVISAPERRSTSIMRTPPDALEAAIAALRPHVSNRLITVFGAGGDRDQGKRPEMGAGRARLSTSSSSPTTIPAARIRQDPRECSPARRSAWKSAVAAKPSPKPFAWPWRGHHPRRGQGPRDRPDHRRGANERCFRSTMPLVARECAA